jgi:hypothetical protein
VKGSKRLTSKQQKKRKVDGQSVHAPNLYLVPAEALEEPIYVISNLGGESGDFILFGLSTPGLTPSPTTL